MIPCNRQLEYYIVSQRLGKVPDGEWALVVRFSFTILSQGDTHALWLI
jgi:hypothetical protein